MNKKKKSFENFSVKMILKIFKFSFILDQSQICISNRLEVRAFQKEVLICENAFIHRDCITGIGNVFTQTDTISKRKKIAILAWRQMKVTYDFLIIGEISEHSLLR